MLIPKNFEQKIGFDRIKSMIASFCSSTLGTNQVEKISFTFKKDLLQKLLDQTSELMKLQQSGESIPATNFPDLYPYLKTASTPGAFLEGEQLYEVASGIEKVIDFAGFLNKRRDECPQLNTLFDHFESPSVLMEQIYDKIDDRGQVKDKASPELNKVRASIITEENRARKLLHQIISQSKKNGYLPENGSLTIRNGRLVLPIKAEFKRKVKGFIHDESATGSIVYLEPAEVLELNNHVRELKFVEKREIIKILTALTDELRPHKETLMHLNRLSGILDMIKAKAIFARKIEAILPEWDKPLQFNWINARHPLLSRKLEEEGKKIVPLNINIDQDHKIIVISGPNAGGKSVCLKTVGLLQYMLQCGLPIPVQEGSTACIFKDIFIDIGDEQSIDNDLSTYSSHLHHMQSFLKSGRKESLFLIDEFGTGTDPQFGGSIAEALLTEYNKQKMRGVVTTHYSNLKKMAEHTQGIINASMKYDMTRLEPLYELELGRPGSSFALEIAEKMGIPGFILNQARKKIGYDQVKMDKLLNELEQERSEIKIARDSIDKKQRALDTALNQYESLKHELDEKRNTLINEARNEARQKLKDTNREIERIVREIRESQADREKTKQLRTELKEITENNKPLKTRRKKYESEEIKVLEGPIRPGDFVRLKGQDTIGEVLKVEGKSAEIMLGQLSSKIKLNRLEKISKKKARKEERSKSTTVRSSNYDINQVKSEFETTLDLRGQRGETAIPALTSFLDKAILFEQSPIKILHGKGNGILRDLVRQELRGYKEIRTFYNEHADRGGDGITIVELK